ncbi:hypothetical protein H696_01963 [Fonticula alba]|uniref:DH domain-containing protein n=1 Tax=Fonticula alba TaxID=691883 RepID=A0A058ZC53_FONAL|nr:hypothetical protein H696_01963 [Fonticula alba]KCV71017.1 hypothetical protein H696_01963 [Fonticula alba]|eukprot:XP_009494140.1 hypothetical protein H696_01963 [Fonticula alba]
MPATSTEAELLPAAAAPAGSGPPPPRPSRPPPVEAPPAYIPSGAPASEAGAVTAVAEPQAEDSPPASPPQPRLVSTPAISGGSAHASSNSSSSSDITSNGSIGASADSLSREASKRAGAAADATPKRAGAPSDATPKRAASSAGSAGSPGGVAAAATAMVALFKPRRRSSSVSDASGDDLDKAKPKPAKTPNSFRFTLRRNGTASYPPERPQITVVYPPEYAANAAQHSAEVDAHPPGDGHPPADDHGDDGDDDHHHHHQAHQHHPEEDDPPREDGHTPAGASVADSDAESIAASVASAYTSPVASPAGGLAPCTPESACDSRPASPGVGPAAGPPPPRPSTAPPDAALGPGEEAPPGSEPSRPAGSASPDAEADASASVGRSASTSTIPASVLLAIAQSSVPGAVFSQDAGVAAPRAVLPSRRAAAGSATRHSLTPAAGTGAAGGPASPAPGRPHTLIISGPVPATDPGPGSPGAADPPMSPQSAIRIMPIPATPASRDAIPEVYSALGDKREMRFQLAARELRQTERDFRSDLEVMIHVYRAGLAASGYASADIVASIFSNIDDIWRVSDHFISEMDTCMDPPGPAVGDDHSLTTAEQMAEALLKCADFFLHFSAFCCNYNNAIRVLGDLPEKGTQLLVNISKQVPTCRQLGLEAFLMTPVQRICKYPLLIREMLKCTEEDTPGHARMTEAFAAVNAIVDEVNLQKRKAENVEILQALAGRLRGLENFKLADLERELLLEIEIDLNYSCFPGHDSAFIGSERRTLFIFNDLLLLAKPQLLGGDKLTVCIGPLQTSSLAFYDSRAAERPYLRNQARSSVAAIHHGDFANPLNLADSEPGPVTGTQIDLAKVGRRYATAEYATLDLGTNFTKITRAFEKAAIRRNLTQAHLLAEDSLSESEKKLFSMLQRAAAAASSASSSGAPSPVVSSPGGGDLPGDGGPGSPAIGPPAGDGADQAWAPGAGGSIDPRSPGSCSASVRTASSSSITPMAGLLPGEERIDPLEAYRREQSRLHEERLQAQREQRLQDALQAEAAARDAEDRKLLVQAAKRREADLRRDHKHDSARRKRELEVERTRSRATQGLQISSSVLGASPGAAGGARPGPAGGPGASSGYDAPVPAVPSSRGPAPAGPPAGSRAGPPPVPPPTSRTAGAGGPPPPAPPPYRPGPADASSAAVAGSSPGRVMGPRTPGWKQ